MVKLIPTKGSIAKGETETQRGCGCRLVLLLPSDEHTKVSSWSTMHVTTLAFRSVVLLFPEHSLGVHVILTSSVVDGHSRYNVICLVINLRQSRVACCDTPVSVFTGQRESIKMRQGNVTPSRQQNEAREGTITTARSCTGGSA